MPLIWSKSQHRTDQVSSTTRTKTRTGGHPGNQNTGFTTWTLSRVLLLDLRLTASLPLRHSFKDQRIPTLSFRLFLSSNLQASRQHTAGCVMIQLVRHFYQSWQYHQNTITIIDVVYCHIKNYHIIKYWLEKHIGAFQNLPSIILILTILW